MAIDITEIGAVYDALSLKAVGTMSKLFDDGVIEAKDKAQVAASTINNVLQLSVQTVQQEKLNSAQIAQITAQTSTIASEMAIKTAQSTKDLLVKDAQIGIIGEQKTTEVKKQELTTRQSTAYDDNKRIKKAEVLGNTTGMYAAGGTTIPTELTTNLFSAINAI